MPAVKLSNQTRPVRTATKEHPRREETTDPPLRREGQRPAKQSPQPTIYVIGYSAMKEEVIEALMPLEVDLREKKMTLEAQDFAGQLPCCLVLVSPLPEASIAQLCRLYRADAARFALPIFIIIPDGTPGHEERRLYKNGTTAVFEWPRERTEIPRLVVGMLDSKVTTRPTHSDQALKEAIRARLKGAGDTLRDRLFLIVVDGTVFLRAEVEDLWQLEYAEKVIKETPGVRAVFRRDFLLSRCSRSDQRLASLIRSLINDSGNLSTGTLDITVTRGSVHVLGTVDHRGEIESLEGLISPLRGVRGINTRLTPSRRLRQRDRSVAEEIRLQIELRFPEFEIEVSAFGSVAVLTGTVDRFSSAKRLEAIALQREGVLKVINKITVESKLALSPIRG